MFDYKIGISEEEHDTFVIQHPQVNLLQSSSWAKIKDNWGNERLGFYKNGAENFWYSAYDPPNK